MIVLELAGSGADQVSGSIAKGMAAAGFDAFGCGGKTPEAQCSASGDGNLTNTDVADDTERTPPFLSQEQWAALGTLVLPVLNSNDMQSMLDQVLSAAAACTG